MWTGAEFTKYHLESISPHNYNQVIMKTYSNSDLLSLIPLSPTSTHLLKLAGLHSGLDEAFTKSELTLSEAFAAVSELQSKGLIKVGPGGKLKLRKKAIISFINKNLNLNEQATII